MAHILIKGDGTPHQATCALFNDVANLVDKKNPLIAYVAQLG